jgi:hypothetical protein
LNILIARLLQTLSAVQSQLRDLEDENSISRRRVRELEMELEECKRHVARERTRLIERDELNDLGGYGQTTQTIRNKGKGRAVEPSIDTDDERLHERYKDAVEEKKGLCALNLQITAILFIYFVPALEALINSLRSHLTRLTSELASHQDLLTELRNLRDSDSRALKEKGADIIKLREEVQRLAGEVEVLRGVIEEGLKERRASREIHAENSVADTAMSQDLEKQELEEGNEDEDEDVVEEDDSDQILSDVEEEEEAEAEPFDPVSIHEESSRVNQADKTMRTDFATVGSMNQAESMTSRRFEDKEEPMISSRVNQADKTMRTDFATVGSTNPAESMTSRRFVDKEELDRISAEVEERRSNRSSNSIGSQSRRARSPSNRTDRRATVEDEEEHERLPQTSNILHHSQSRLLTTEPNMTHHSQSRLQQQITVQSEPPSFRPSTPAAGYYAPAKQTAGPARFQEHLLQDEPETPFPQIRGEHLERLFFSAPEHNAKTCTVCYRLRHRTCRS